MRIVLPKKVLLSVASVVFVAGISAGGYYAYSWYTQQPSLLPSTMTDAQKEYDWYLGKIGRHMLLPQEQATLATVTDTTQLPKEPFFAQAQTGDRVLLYKEAQKAILYRPSVDKIIEVTSVNMSNVAGESTSSAGLVTPQQQTPRVVLLNGTLTTGLAKQAEKKLRDNGTQIEVVAKGNAKGAYRATVVVDVTGVNKDRVQEVVTLFGGTLLTMPEGESSPTAADIVVILGENLVE